MLSENKVKLNNLERDEPHHIYSVVIALRMMELFEEVSRSFVL